MKINDINNKKVKIGVTSITVKDDNDKTCGVVRNISRFKDLSPRMAQPLWKKLRECGLWGTKYMENVVVCDGQLCYLHNLKADKFYHDIKEILTDCEMLEDETKRFDYRQDVKNRAEANGIKVMSCYLM